MSVSNLSDIIRWPFLMIGKILNFILNYLIEILIIVGSIYFIWWLFNSGVIKRLSEMIKKSKEVENETRNI